MELPTSVAALLIAAFAILPGVPGERIYTMLVGWDWREDKWWRTLRLLAFSLVGLSVYAIAAPVLSAPMPVYISPRAMELLRTNQVGQLAVAFLGHVVCAAFTGVAAGYAEKLVALLTARSEYSNAWDHFVNLSAKKQWVTVGLANGQVYAGYIDKADMSVAAAERDMILREPRLFDEKDRAFRVTRNKSMFLLGSTIVAVSVVRDLREFGKEAPNAGKEER